MSISTELDQENKQLKIIVKGRFDYNLQKEFQKSYKENNTINQSSTLISNYTIDLTDVNYLDSSALGMLLSLRKYSNHQDCVDIIGAKDSIKELLELSGFDKLFRIIN